MQQFKFKRCDDGFCRVYYRGVDDNKLYCIQDDTAWGNKELNFYECTKSEGEPIAPLPFPTKDRFEPWVDPSTR